MELGGGGVSWGVQSRPTSGHMGMCIFPNFYVGSRSCVSCKSSSILSILILGRPGFLPGVGLRPGFFATLVWAPAGHRPHFHMSSMPNGKEVAEKMRAKARAVRHDGSYGGVFEMCVWCTLKKVSILMASVSP